MKANNYAVIMAGGIGSRFWPYSRANYPKQFLDIFDSGVSLLQMTYNRFLKVCPKENIYIVSNDKYEGLIKEQLPDLTDDQILLEPSRRNTAPCIAYASYKIAKQNPDARMVVTPSDHAIFKEDNFLQQIEVALEESGKSNKLITLGIQPTRPETGYGYIQYLQDDNTPVKKVKTFTEKPDHELAQKFLESGDFVWNAGIFVWNTQAILNAFGEHLSDIAEIFEDVKGDLYTDKEKSAIQKAYSQCKNISIDYGIMESSDDVYVVLGDFGWSDLGSWNSLHELREKDNAQNVVDGNALLYDTKNSMIKGDHKKLIVAQGLEGYLIADCDDVLLICKKDLESKLREFVNDVKTQKGEHYL